jgi:hypothetical protein
VAQHGFASEGRIKEIREERGEIVHQISSDYGQSGAAIFLNDNDSYAIVGVHKGGITTPINGVSTKANGGRLITLELIEALKVEAARMGAQPFKVQPQAKEMGADKPKIGK